MKITSHEAENRQLDPDSLAIAVRTLNDSGMLVLDGLYDPLWVDDLRRTFDATLERERSRDGSPRVQATSGTGHTQMQVPLVAPFSDPAIVANPIVLQVLSAVLGEDVHCAYYNSNAAAPGSSFQTVHRDARPLFGSELAVPTPISSIVMNLPLCDFTEENGSTEVWPGSHLIVDDPRHDTRTGLDARAAALASTRFNVSAGAVALRDLRVWHRGMPNRSDRVRSMLAVVYQRSWLGWRAPSLRVPRATWEAWPEEVRSVFALAPIEPGEM
ncbi:MAG TPA: phytanoyl-CoA dioxygenase family protein [Mycobacteriales bacterium]|nr:phytanoyl-CoA dioxygenase family protein [Mycobacteriales bacterium]